MDVGGMSSELLRGSGTTRTRPMRSLTGRWRECRCCCGDYRLAAQPGIVAFLLGLLGDFKIALRGCLLRLPLLLLLLLLVVLVLVVVGLRVHGRRTALGEENVDAVGHDRASANLSPTRKVVSPDSEGTSSCRRTSSTAARFSPELEVTMMALE